jgi:hypothetical protein
VVHGHLRHFFPLALGLGDRHLNGYEAFVNRIGRIRAMIVSGNAIFGLVATRAAPRERLVMTGVRTVWNRLSRWIQEQPTARNASALGIPVTVFKTVAFVRSATLPA